VNPKASRRRPVALAVCGALILASLGIVSRSAGALSAPLPLGNLSLTTATDSSCPSGHTCRGFKVACPSVQRTARGFLARAPARSARVRGLVVISTGGQGTQWFSAKGAQGASFVSDLQRDGFVVVQLRWVDPWLVSAPGEDAGSGHLGCRPATAFKWVHDRWFVPLGVPAGPIGRCGFCITGNSGGASQSSYALSHYGLESLLEAVVPTGGPPHAAQAKGCLRNAGQDAYWYASGSAATIDSSYGFQGTSGPCALHDASFVPRWDAESVDTGGSDYLHEQTRVHFILGGADNSSAPAHARDYAARLKAAGSPYVTLQVIPGMGHSIVNSAGLGALRSALTNP
jgi:pimeloyl-ACP methyl ester carboxylesterase